MSCSTVIGLIEKAQKMVQALCEPKGNQGSREWIMSIPARPEHDPDIVIGTALSAAKHRIEEQDKLVGLGLIVGDDLRVYGSHEAIKRVQDIMLIDSQHPVEREDVRRGLLKDVRRAEAKIIDAKLTMCALARMLSKAARRDVDSPVQLALDEANAFIGDFDEDAERERRAYAETPGLLYLTVARLQ